MEQSLQHQIRHEYNKTGRMLNRTDLNPLTIQSHHVTVVMDAIQLKVTFIMRQHFYLIPGVLRTVRAWNLKLREYSV